VCGERFGGFADEVAMNFNGRWVPMEVMDTIVLLWAIAAILVVFVLFRVMRVVHPKKTHSVKQQKNVHRKRNGKHK
jgi:beta-lactamase regulating signal transducer with metallopeptidase domain